MKLPATLAILAMLALIGSVLAIQVYRMRHTRYIRPEFAQVTDGVNIGREGRIVSDWPLDFLVTLNVAATDGEKHEWATNKRAEILASKQFVPASDEEWIQESIANLRHWVTVWRWQVEWLAEEPANGVAQ